MPVRKLPLIEGKIYHIFTKSIAGFQIFRCNMDYRRMLQTLTYYNDEKPPLKFSSFLKTKKGISEIPHTPTKLVKIIAYCLMPTHLHLILQQVKKNGISNYMGQVLKSYSKYFNEKYNRKGPLMESRFKNVLVETDEQLLHLTRYLHLNPVTAYLTEKPEDWIFSSYQEYIGEKKERICEFEEFLDINGKDYKTFVYDRIDYQRKLAEIKHLLLE